jgi:hypothetical protein
LGAKLEVVSRFRGALSALLASGVAIIALQLLPWPGDFAPFVMTITEYDTNRVGFSDGRTLAGTAVYRLEYRDHNNWTYTLISDDVPGYGFVASPGQGYACRGGEYGTFDAQAAFRITSREPHVCYAIGRWIGYGIAWAVPWEKVTSNGIVTYTSYGERVCFDLKTGLPIQYEAGTNPGAVGHHVTTFQVEH